ncbi:NACHT domain-containing protein [Actinacidiphila glaucinigra]|uniref:NACHT domain-containing protein n=1 Tax=Actinacidiphila glaucinigra TaxID=235986 RepID=UPI0036718DF1
MRYLMLVILGGAGALLLAWSFELGTAATAVVVVLGLAPAYISWAAFRADRAEADVDLDTVAEQLAVAVKAQWDDEAAIRRVNDPYPLPVAWRAADEDLAEPWLQLTDLARAWPGGPPGDPIQWPMSVAGLAGRDAQIGEVFVDRVPTRRLVILGEPGAGKSVLLIRLLQDLLERRIDGAPVPVLFSLASWNPQQPLKAWLAEQLRRNHPGLTAAAPRLVTAAANSGGDLAQAMLDAGRILPMLDGFDELPSALRVRALDALNRAVPAKQPLVLASRAVPYRTALTRPGTTLRLSGAAAIQLLPLAADVAATYLRRDAGGMYSLAARRWDAVSDLLGTTTPVGRALSTPLGLFLARTIYNHRSQTSGTPHPDELCDTAAFPTRAAVDAHLFSALIPAVYSRDSPRPSLWTAAQAHRTLIFLARFLQNQRRGSPDLAWWELPQALPMFLRQIIHGLTIGIVVGLPIGVFLGFAFGAETGLSVGISGGLLFGLTAALQVDHVIPGARLRWSPKESVIGIVFGLLVGTLLGIVFGLAIADAYGLGAGLGAGLVLGLAVVLAAGLVTGLETEAPDLTSNNGPVVLLSTDRRSFMVVGFGIGCAAALGFALMYGLAFGLVEGISNGIDAVLAAGAVVGLGAGFVFGLLGLATALCETAWAYFIVVRLPLVACRKIPADLMGFLQDAHEHRGVLRQVGAVYQFRHIDLQRHLARQQP